MVCPARADTGVSDARVSLPDGPGSVGGAGENLSSAGNMGSMTHVVPLELPPGSVGATPSLALAYNSMNGSGEVGMGWELPIPHIERFTLRGVPRYSDADVFAVDGSEELVRVSGSISGIGASDPTRAATRAGTGCSALYPTDVRVHAHVVTFGAAVGVSVSRPVDTD